MRVHKGLLVAAMLSVVTGAGATPFECLIAPAQVVEIRSPVEGVIDKIYVQRGDEVRRGQTLVELESGVERSTMESAKYRAQMEGHVASARNRQHFATKKFERMRELNSKNYIPAQQRDEAETEKRLSESELQDATENRELAKLEYQRAIDLLRLRSLRSPFNGVVVDRMLNPGDLAESGTGRKPVLKLALIDPLRVEVVLPLAAYGKIKAGTSAQVMPEVLGGSYPAVVKVVDRVVDAASGTFGVRLELANRNKQVPAGIRCQIEFAELQAGLPKAAAREGKKTQVAF